MADTDPSAKESLRDRFHDMVREAILDAAWARMIASDWDDVRISDIADDIGVSRQSIYKEIGAKDQVATALFERELAGFMDRIISRTTAASSLTDAIRDSLTGLLSEAQEHPLLERVRAQARQGKADSALILMTVRADTFLVPIRSAMVETYTQRWEVPPEAAEWVSDLMIRLAVSWCLMPTDLQHDAVIDHVVGMVTAVPTTPR